MAFRELPISDEQLFDDASRLVRILLPGGLNYHDRQDIEQEVAIQLLKARQTFDPEKGNWQNYSMYRARSAVRDWFRKNPVDGIAKKRGQTEATILSSYDMRLHEWPIEDVYQQLAIEDAVRPLSPKYRLAVKCLMAGFSNRDVERALGISLDTLSLRLRNLLRENLKYYLSLLTD